MWSIFKVLKGFDFFQKGSKSSRGFAVVFADFVEMFFGFVFAFAANFLNFAMHGIKKNERREVSQF